MRVQVIYGEYAEADFACRACRGTGRHPANAQTRCWACMGRGNTLADQRAYTYEAPEGTRLWDVLVTPTPQQGGKFGTVVKLSSDYDGPVRQAYRLTFPCMGNCGTALPPAVRRFCDVCWARVPESMRTMLAKAPGSSRIRVVRAISDYLSVMNEPA